MATKNLPDPEMLRQLLRYEPETGKFSWRARPDDFNGTLRRVNRNWNTRFAGKEAFASISKRGYHDGVILCTRYYAHRVAWAMHYGEWPSDVIDHIDGNPLNNKIENLRCVTQAINSRNCRLVSGETRRNRTGVSGVWWDKRRQKYQAYIDECRKRKYLGRFDSIEDAIRARKEAERGMGFHPNHGRQAPTNARCNSPVSE